MDPLREEELSIASEQQPAGAGASLFILLSSPRVPAGVLTRSAWQVLTSADAIYAADLDDGQAAAVLTSGLTVRAVSDTAPAHIAQMLAHHQGQVVWIGSTDGDPGLTDALAAEWTVLSDPPTVEMVVGSWDLPGARLLDAVTVMDTLRSPGGCPWDAEQTHDSLAKYLVEETYETLEAIENRDRQHLAEELGDVLLQVLFHARVAAEDQREPFDIDDVAGALVAKLIRRHPHVFAGGEASTSAEVEASWEQIKAVEKSDRDSADLLAGVPSSLPALLTAQKLVTRLARRGAAPAYADSTALGARLVELVVEANAAGLSAESLVRREVHDVAATYREAAREV
ncbi:MAG: MazG family protein [Allobranchiibius sp.]